jgi:hypothetical protein
MQSTSEAADVAATGLLQAVQCSVLDIGFREHTSHSLLPLTSVNKGKVTPVAQPLMGWALGPYVLTLTLLPVIWMSAQVKLLSSFSSSNQPPASAIACSL